MENKNKKIKMTKETEDGGTRANQTMILSLEEAVDLQKMGIRGVSFLGSERLFGSGEVFNFSIEENGREAIIHLISSDVYAARIDTSLPSRCRNPTSFPPRAEIINIGKIWEYPGIIEFSNELGKLDEFNDKKRHKDKSKLISKYLTKSLPLNLSSMPTSKVGLYESGGISDDGLGDLGFWNDKKEFDQFFQQKRLGWEKESEKRSQPTEEGGGAFLYLPNPKNWNMVVCYSSPGMLAACSFETPRVHSNVAMDYSGREPLTDRVFRDKVGLRDLGNGVVTMSKDRVPLYLKRKLGIGDSESTTQSQQAAGYD